MERKKLPALSLDECIAAAGGTKSFVTGKDVYREIPALLGNLFNAKSIFIIADANTMNAAGNDLARVLAEQGIEVAGTCIFPGEPRLHAEYAHIAAITKAFAADCGAANGSPQPIPAAVGSGTINDLVKLAATELSLPYLCVPTAASVDGFTSFGSAILKNGFKQTIPCGAPRCIVADTGILAKAPAWLSSSGFADLAGKIIAGSDWIISDAAAAFNAKGADLIEPKAWAMVQHGLYDYLERSVCAAQGDQDALQALFEALAITGFAMQYTQDSRPVSGCEHLFAHIWEMDDLCVDGNPVTHGHKVAIGTLAATAFTEIFFAGSDGPPAPPTSFRRPSLEDRIAEIKTAFARSPALDSAVATGVDKFPDEKTAALTAEGIRSTWKELRSKIFAQITPYAELKEMLAKARCPVLPAEVNLKRANIISCAKRAQMIRKRYNVLDLAWDLGCFETVLAKMEASGIYFY
jgi:glycerol-1-phosphate dehydrogenase [NAD(P)+]